MTTKLKDSGHREIFSNGYVREPKTGLGRYDLLPPEALQRMALHYEQGAIKYAPRNWEKGGLWSVNVNSAMRHLVVWLMGDDSEDHLAACCWNLWAVMWYEKHHQELNDIPTRKK